MKIIQKFYQPNHYPKVFFNETITQSPHILTCPKCGLGAIILENADSLGHVGCANPECCALFTLTITMTVEMEQVK